MPSHYHNVPSQRAVNGFTLHNMTFTTFHQPAKTFFSLFLGGITKTGYSSQKHSLLQNLNHVIFRQWTMNNDQTNTGRQQRNRTRRKRKKNTYISSFFLDFKTSAVGRNMRKQYCCDLIVHLGFLQFSFGQCKFFLPQPRVKEGKKQFAIFWPSFVLLLFSPLKKRRKKKAEIKASVTPH